MNVQTNLRNTQKWLRRKAGVRRFHAYCIGAAKTGTTTVAGMLNEEYISAHEPDTIATNRLVIDYVALRLEAQQVSEFLRVRDRKLCLEMESAHPLGYLAPIIQEIFPAAKFIVTVREPYSWLRSRVNFHGNTDPSEWREYRDYFFVHRSGKHAPEEALLEKRGLAPLDTYLRQYAEHYKLLIEKLDWSRALLIRTSELSACVPELARFLEIKPQSVKLAHKKRSKSTHDLLSEIDHQFVSEAINRNCREIIERWFPERQKIDK